MSTFNVHEDFIGLHHVNDIKTDIIVAVLKDTIFLLNLDLSMCRGQCYDSAANMKKAAAEINTPFAMAWAAHLSFLHPCNILYSSINRR